MFDVHIKDHINQITAANDSLDAKVSIFNNGIKQILQNLMWLRACLVFGVPKSQSLNEIEDKLTNLS